MHTSASLQTSQVPTLTHAHVHSLEEAATPAPLSTLHMQLPLARAMTSARLDGATKTFRPVEQQVCNAGLAQATLHRRTAGP